MAAIVIASSSRLGYHSGTYGKGPQKAQKARIPSGNQWYPVGDGSSQIGKQDDRG